MNVWLKDIYGINNMHGIQIVSLVGGCQVILQSEGMPETRNVKEVVLKDPSGKALKTFPVHHEKEIFGFSQTPTFLTNDFDHKYIYDGAWVKGDYIGARIKDLSKLSVELVLNDGSKVDDSKIAYTIH